MNKINKRAEGLHTPLNLISKMPLLLLCASYVLSQDRFASSWSAALDIVASLNYIQGLLTQIGPIISAILFIVAGIFYSIGQLFPAHQRANFHSTAIDIIIGAIIVAVLSVASNSLSFASAHLLSNLTNVS